MRVRPRDSRTVDIHSDRGPPLVLSRFFIFSPLIFNRAKGDGAKDRKMEKLAVINFAAPIKNVRVSSYGLFFSLDLIDEKNAAFKTKPIYTRQIKIFYFMDFVISSLHFLALPYFLTFLIFSRAKRDGTEDRKMEKLSIINFGAPIKKMCKKARLFLSEFYLKEYIKEMLPLK